MAKTKLGFHCLQGPDGIGDLVSAGCALVVSVDDMGVLEEARRLAPATPRMARFFIPNITAESLRNGDPKSAAEWYVRQFSAQINSNLSILRDQLTWMIGPNEPVFKKPDPKNPGKDIDDTDALNWYMQFERRRTEVLGDMGIQAAVFGLSSGYPAIESWSYLLPILPTLKAHNGILNIHGYSGGAMALDQYGCFRYELIWESYLRGTPYEQIGIMYGEWARNYPWDVPGLTEDQYFAEFVSADARLRAFKGNLIGVAAFSLGGNKDWAKFSISKSLAARLANYIRNATPVPPVPPLPEPVPVPTPAPVSIIVNPSFEDSWTTDANGNQTPHGWFLNDYKNQILKYNLKHQNGQSVPTKATETGIYVHKGFSNGAWTLPFEERKGGARALILDGVLCYKMGSHLKSGTFAGSISQKLNVKKGDIVRVTVPIIAESPDLPTAPNTKLEDDHFRILVYLNDYNTDHAERTYADMAPHNGKPGSVRAWTNFVVEATVPDDGMALVIYVQQNWPGQLDVFVDDIKVEILKPEPVPSDPPIVIPDLHRGDSIAIQDRATQGLYLRYNPTLDNQIKATKPAKATGVVLSGPVVDKINRIPWYVVAFDDWATGYVSGYWVDKK